MTFTDYLLNITLIGLVILQIRGHRLTKARLVFPLVATVVVAGQFLHTIPTAGNDLLLIVGLACVGGTLGALAGLATTVRRDGSGAFAKAGVVAAVLWIVGIEYQISDGGAAVIVMSKAKADKLGVAPLGELVSYGQVAGPSPSLLHQPSHAITVALDKAGLATGDIDLFEINEAFAAVGLASADDLGIGEDKVNVNGGAIALGHPVGMSGTRVALTALLELKRRGGGTAAVALCGGGGQGDAAVLRTI